MTTDLLGHIINTFPTFMQAVGILTVSVASLCRRTVPKVKRHALTCLAIEQKKLYKCFYLNGIKRVNAIPVYFRKVWKHYYVLHATVD